MKSIHQLLAATVMATALTVLAGCAGTTSRYAVSQGSAGAKSQAVAKPIPRVQDCGVLQTGTPSRFVCNGTVYTSFQLAKSREEEARKYAGK